MAADLEWWVVYRRPADYPHSIVARRFGINGPSHECIISPDIATVRFLLRCRGLRLCMDRAPEDEPQIVETWL